MRAVYLRLTALAFSTLCGLCIFRVCAHADAPKNSHPLNIGRFVANPRSSFPFPLLCFFSSPLPHPHPPWTASSVFRFDGETMKSLSPMAIATSAGRNQCCSFFRFYFPIYINICFSFFSICLWFTPEHSRFLPWAWHLWPRHADNDNACGLDKNFPDTLRSASW